LVILSILLSAIIVIISWQDIPYNSTDSHWYIQLAQGQNDEVVKPFSYRVLHPYLVGTVSRLFGLSLDTSFLIIGVISLLVLCVTTTLSIIQITPKPLFVILLLFSCFLYYMFRDYYLPDLFHAALLSIFFFLLITDKLWFALVILPFLQITRESTILLSIITILVSFYKRKFKFAFVALLVIVFGIIISSFYGNLGQPNIHDANTLIYAGLKVFYNFAKNILGVVLWTDTLASQPGLFPADPLFTFKLPEWLPAGSMEMAGIYSFDPIFPISTFVLLLTLFGLAPVFLMLAIIQKKKNILYDSPAWVLILVVYGLIAFLLGPMLGASVQRLIGYGWPLFWIGFPYIMDNYYKFTTGEQIFLYILSLAICWIPYILGIFSFSILLSTLLLAIVILIYYFVIKRAKNAIA